MRRTVSLLALVLALAGCAATEPERPPLGPPRAAEPQRVELRWRESWVGPESGRLVFEVDELDVTANGWSVRIAVRNESATGFEIETGPFDYGFGLMLFATGDLEAVEEANREGRLPAIRRATRIEPEPPRVLRPGVTWRATLSAPGSLADGSWMRVVFGTFLGQGDAPEEFRRVVWFTDRSYRL